MESPWTHTTVLLHEAVQALEVRPNATYVDATFGRGGHSRLILSQLGPQGRLIVFDKDPEAIAQAQALNDPRLTIRHEGFAALATLPAASVAGVLMDLGVSSPQIASFLAGMLVGLAQGERARESAEIGIHWASFAIQSSSSVPPHWDEIQPRG